MLAGIGAKVWSCDKQGASGYGPDSDVQRDIKCEHDYSSRSLWTDVLGMSVSRVDLII